MINFWENISASKSRRRLSGILTNSIKGLLLPMLNPLVAALVIHFTSVMLWGEFVKVMILIQFGTHIVGWGNKEYLLRSFSRNPSKIKSAWLGNLRARFLILAGVILILPFWIQSLPLLMYAVAWSIGLSWYQSLEVFIQYYKDFAFALWVELISLVGLVTGVYFFSQQLSEEILIILFGISTLFKAAAITYRYRSYTFQPDSQVQTDYLSLIDALPFFLLGFSGMLQSRIDLYSISFFFGESELGAYQVFINFMLYLQAIANFILVPFVKNLYRMDYEAIQKIAQRLFFFGVLITPPVLGAIFVVLREVYQLEFSYPYYIVGGFYVLPSYFFLPIIYALYKAEKQNRVLILNFAGSAMILGLNLVFIPWIGLLGAMLSVTIVHWGLLVIYAWQMKKLE